MGKDITPFVPGSQPPTTPFSARWLDNLRRGLGRRDGSPVIRGFSLTTEKQEEVRAEIRIALSTFRQLLTAVASDTPQIGMELARLLGAFPTQDPGMSAALRIDAYKEAISDAPLWAVREARLRVIRGRVGAAHRFAPSPPEFVQIIDDVISRHRSDLADLERLAVADFEDAPIPPPPERPGLVRWGDVAVHPVTGRFDKPSPLRHSTVDERAAAAAALKQRMEKLGVDPSALGRIGDQPVRVEHIGAGLNSYIAKED